MLVKSFFITIWSQILLGTRISLDCATSLLFGIIYCRETRKIECAKNPILLESATSLAEKIRKKQLKSVEVIAAYISRIKEIQPILNVVVENRFEQALEEGRNVDELIASQIYTEEALEQRFPLLGVPFSSKESLAIKGMRVTCGLVWKSDNLASEDCDAVKLLRKAGAIPLVTTNVPEMCASWESYNKVYGRSKNPYNIKRTVGGSSGGEGGLLGAGGSVIGIGSDLGGSIRIPALFNGIFAHKPSKRIVSIKGIFPQFLHDNEDYCVVGPMTRYSTDLSLMMKVMAGNNASRLKLDEKI
ncbi:fatty-acid amide hydrolase 2-A-like [Centruroides sculpturatus]|uniref:fatty-acid amide hydrolase 2-A-like n=1 Tax=Centruroides sculpturatus TaxID=218467 RepID=UPI000C6E8B22|nr:fatty-acid amide hydrolase 2-A-like [Centruroides sculpturatus]